MSMIRYKKNIKSGVIRLPKPVVESFGDEVEIAPNQVALVIYPSNEDRKNVIKSLELIIEGLKFEIEMGRCG